MTIKDALKERGYKWNGVEQTWDKEIEDGSDEEEQFLNSLGVLKQPEQGVSFSQAWYSIGTPGMYVEAIVYIVAEGNTYECRETLKEYHFFFKNKQWLCKVKSNEINNMLLSLKEDKRLSGINFGVLKRKK